MGKDVIVACDFSSAEATFAFLDKFTGRKPFVKIGGLRILGLGGCQRYRPGPHQYTEAEMERRIRRLRWQLWKHGGVDIVISHAPVRGYGDRDTMVHRGFEAFLKLLNTYKPKYWVYGHVHMSYSNNQPRVLQHGATTLINACERYVIDVD